MNLQVFLGFGIDSLRRAFFLMEGARQVHLGYIEATVPIENSVGTVSRNSHIGTIRDCLGIPCRVLLKSGRASKSKYSIKHSMRLCRGSLYAGPSTLKP